MRPTFDPTLCPLCRQDNRCANEIEKATGEKQPPCWCTTVKFDASVLARVPAEARDVACLCARCARPV